MPPLTRLALPYSFVRSLSFCFALSAFAGSFLRLCESNAHLTIAILVLTAFFSLGVVAVAPRMFARRCFFPPLMLNPPIQGLPPDRAKPTILPERVDRFRILRNKIVTSLHPSSEIAFTRLLP